MEIVTNQENTRRKAGNILQFVRVLGDCVLFLTGRYFFNFDVEYSNSDSMGHYIIHILCYGLCLGLQNEINPSQPVGFLPGTIEEGMDWLGFGSALPLHAGHTANLGLLQESSS